MSRASTLILGAMAAVVALPCSAAPGRPIAATGAWTAIERPGQCEARSRSLTLVGKGKVQGESGFTFTVDRRHWGEFHATLRRLPRAGASVILMVDRQPFLLVARGNQAWGNGALQDQAIIAAIRDAGTMRIDSRDQGGARFSDPYAVAGAATAIDAAAARCAGKAR